MTRNPEARRDDLIVRDVGDEAVVFDFRTHQASCLNRAAAVIWRLCDGKRGTPELTRAARRELGTVDEASVRQALLALSKHDLLLAPWTPPRQSPGSRSERGTGPADMTRRRLLKHAAMTAGLAIAVPAVWSIVAPTPAYAASGIACFSAASCMGAGSPSGCCNNGGNAGTCTAALTCGGTSSSCNGQMCGS